MRNTPVKTGDDLPPLPSSTDNRFSLVELRKIHQQLLENKNVDEDNKNLVVEILRVIAEMVVYGDNKSEMLFDFFCEKNMLQLFLEIMWTKQGCPVSVHIQILQTLSILISCVRNDTSLYYLLSNNYINEMINFPHDFSADESLVAQFASFMKSLSLRLNVQTVQFFFIEDTGAFPLLTKAVELLNNKDPMIRISAQTTILNVYQVDEPRSRAYALQDDVMSILFEGIVKIMKDQYASMQKHVVEFLRGSKEQDFDFAKIKQHNEDLGVAIEDWLFYLQDLLELKIEVLQRALSSYLLNQFIGPFLLNAVVSAHKNLQPDLESAICIDSLEIVMPDLNDNKQSRAINSLCETDKDDQSFLVLGMATNALYYLLQLIKILTNSILRHTLFTAIVHPLSQDARFCALSQLVEDKAEVDLSGVDVVLNPFKEAVQYFVSANHSLAVLLISYVYYYISVSCCEDDWSSDPNLLFSKVEFLEALRFIPPLKVPLIVEKVDWSALKSSMEEALENCEKVECTPEESWKKRRRGLDVKKSISALKFGPDYLSPQMIAEVNNVVGSKISTIDTNIDTFCCVLMVPSRFSLTTVQVFVHAIVVISKMLFGFGKRFHADNPDCDSFDGHGTFSLQHIVKQVRLASKNAANALLSRFDSHFSEMLLILINEEIKRFGGRKWKAILPRMTAEKSLMIPESPNIKFSMGIDFELPISQVESVRREVQHFLLLRALQNHLLQFNLFNSKDPELSIFDLSSTINDRDLLTVEETNLVPDHMVSGSAFDMKGKKFLDARLFMEDEEKAALTSVPITQQNSSWSASVLGFMGGSRKSSGNVGSGKNSTADKNGKDKFLFVQDPNLLLIILQRRVDGKSTFRTHVVASLIYADAKLDLTNKKKFVVMVRSWKGIENTQKVELDGDEHVVEPSSAFGPKKADTFLKHPEKSSIYQITLTMDTEQAAALAVQHIESRRRSLTAIKMEKLKNILNKWASSSDVLDNE